jgi:signal peptide peptidase SppA
MPDQIPLAMELFSDHRPWAITPAAMEMMCRVADHPDFEAAAKLRAAAQTIPISNTSGVAVLDIRGPIMRYRSFWTWLLGGTSVEEASTGLQAALDDPTVQSIVLAINSPGGQVDGINEFANSIRAANSQKPVTAYVGGMGASGAYWLAAAAGKIVADETAQLGSIGVLATVMDATGAEQKMGVKRYDVVSSQSPLKRTDPGTDAGRAQLQSVVDSLAQVFIDKVAQFRGTTPAKVESDFGKGAVVLAPAAVAAGMADGLGSLQSVLTDGDRNGMPMRQVRDKPGLRVEGTVAEEPDEEDNPALNDDNDCANPPGAARDPEDDDEDEEDDDEEELEVTASVPEGDDNLLTPTEDRQRIAAILTSEEAKGREELARILALETNHTLEAAKKMLAAVPVAKTTTGFHARMNNVANPQVGVPGNEADADTPAAEVQRILTFIPKDRKRVHVQ